MFRALAIAVILTSTACGQSTTPAFLQAEADALVKGGTEGGVILAIVYPDGRMTGATAGHQSGGEAIPVNG